ncbi:unnamed protein product [Phytomonas sp. Hart1]|nr:unnamed protein product [Phytomonas sp. Hart1]|eukprot:CCW70974.1 unnamed protein product [Phytomonas sp. isolate Hart1]
MGCGYSTFSASEDIVWKYGGPIDTPIKAIKVFPKIENGLLFRILYDGGDRWSFYNDTKEYEFHIRYFFSSDSYIEALHNATLTLLENGQKLVEIIVYPLETEDFIAGCPIGYTSTIEGIPSSNRYKLEKIRSKAHHRI